jgi:hypothetical protein
MALRRLGAVLGAAGLALVMGVGVAGPAQAANITPLKDLKRSSSNKPYVVPKAAPQGPRQPFAGMTPKQIKDRAVKDAKAASWVRVRGAGITTNGEKMSWDVTVGRSAGMMTLTGSKTGTMWGRRVGNRVWLSFDAKFWSTVPDVTPDQARQFAGQWIEYTGDSENTATFRQYMSIGDWTSDLGALNVTKRVVGKTIGGKKTVGLFEAGSNGSVMYVSIAKKPYPLSVQTNDKSAWLTYSNWNKKASINAPARYIQVDSTAPSSDA